MAAMKQRVLDAWDSLTQRLRGAGETIPRLVMRIVMGWEFWESGLEKYNGQNWFADLQHAFPFPFDQLQRVGRTVAVVGDGEQHRLHRRHLVVLGKVLGLRLCALHAVQHNHGHRHPLLFVLLWRKKKV